jgi:hypothetical protein
MLLHGSHSLPGRGVANHMRTELLPLSQDALIQPPRPSSAQPETRQTSKDM